MPEIKKKLGFAVTPTDKVIYSRYDPKRKKVARWSPLIIKDWGDRSLYASPMSVGLNYARSVFEGMKAYRHKDGKIFLFRIFLDSIWINEEETIITNIPPIIAKAKILPVKSPTTASVAPKAKAPPSPKKILAGQTLK